MEKGLCIRIKKKTQSKTVINILLILPFLFATGIEFFHLPGAIKYLCDVAWCFLFLLFCVQKRKKQPSLWRIQMLILLYAVFTLLVYLVKWQSPAYYLWGVRNTFRFYVAFLSFAFFLEVDDSTHWLDLFDKLFWINAAICIVQYMVLGKTQDYLGGIFGVQKGCNAYMNVFFVIITIKSVLYYLSGMEKLHQCVSKCGTAIVLASLAELKCFYVELVLIVALAVLITDFSWKKVLIIAVSIVGGFLGLKLLGNLFSEFRDFFSVEGILAITSDTSGYTGRGDVNRLTAIPIISERFLTTPISRIVGMGLGNCETASYSMFTTPFYLKHSHLHYTWFSTAFVFLETGYIGLTFFFGFFVLIFFIGNSRAKRVGSKEEKVLCQISVIASLCAVIIGVYNVSLRSEAAYMMYFVLSFPLIVERKNLISDRLKEK